MRSTLRADLAVDEDVEIKLHAHWHRGRIWCAALLQSCNPVALVQFTDRVMCDYCTLRSLLAHAHEPQAWKPDDRGSASLQSCCWRPRSRSATGSTGSRPRVHAELHSAQLHTSCKSGHLTYFPILRTYFD